MSCMAIDPEQSFRSAQALPTSSLMFDIASVSIVEHVRPYNISVTLYIGESNSLIIIS